MTLRQFNVGCPCCFSCFDPIIVICIYDESDPVYTFCPNGTYLSDKNDWEEFIVGIGDNTVRLGIIIPETVENGNVRCATEDWPFDSDRLEVDRLVVGFQSPRVFESDILDIFETIRTTPDTIDPQLLLFVLDNSGSIEVEEYQLQLDNAKAILEDLYPDMTILDDIIDAGERWLRDARVGSEGQICP